MADARTADDRATAAEIRTWAAGQGMDVAASGRIPAAVTAAYRAAEEAALQGPGPALPVSDFTDPGDDDLEAGADDPGEPPAAPPPPAEADGGQAPPGDLPPPANLDEARARAGSRPRVPKWAARQSSPAPRRQEGAVKVTAAVRGDIEGKLALLLGIPAMTWSTVDPYCGGAFADNLDNIVKKAVPLICQSPDAVKFLTKGSSFILLLDFMVALGPVGSAVWNHHVAHTVEIITEPPGGAPPGMAPQVHVNSPDLSQYATVGHVPQPRP